MHPFSVLTLGIFVAGYITARWDLVTRLYELAIFAAEYGVVVSQLFAPQCGRADPSPLLQTRAARGLIALTALFLSIFLPIVCLARKETRLVLWQPLPPPGMPSVLTSSRQHPRTPGFGVSAREQLRRRGSF